MGFEKAAKNIIDDFGNGVEFWAKDEMKEINTNSLEDISDDEQFKSLYYTTLLRIAASEQRISLSDEVINTFMEHAFWLENGEKSHNYMNEDARNDVFANLVNGVGTKVKVLISSKEGSYSPKVNLEVSKEYDKEFEDGLIRILNNNKGIGIARDDIKFIN